MLHFSELECIIYLRVSRVGNVSTLKFLNETAFWSRVI